MGTDAARSSTGLPVGTVTFLFTDIEGSTRLLQVLGDQYSEVLAAHGRLMRRAIGRQGGLVIGTAGDSFFAVFASATSASAAAVEAQRRLASARWTANVTLRVRMGLHTGEGHVAGRDYVGLDVHRAARIAAAAHGGEILMSDATRVLLASSLPTGVAVRDLGAHRLKDLETPERLYRVIIDGLPNEFPPPRSVDVGKAHVPPRATSFIGRRAELDAIRQLLRGNRLVTLVGPGGTGKTRLAMETALEAAADYADGAWFVDLSPLTDPALVGPTIARALGLSDQPQWPIVEQLKVHVERREILLVLDNFEHLLPATPLVEDLLRTAPSLSILATSRAVLNLYGAQEFPVAPLALPQPGTAAVMPELTSYEAVALFVERARAVNPAFAISDESGPAVAGICVRVDGLPLAIELAASRVRLLEPREILARLERHLPALATGGLNLPARQRTLQATIEWSYNLLPEPEQALFARLTIFAGGSSLNAAESICNPGRELGLDTFDGLASLVDQSLVRRIGNGTESRFGMLETIRDYGRDRLSDSGKLDEVALRHLQFYRDLAEMAEPELVGPDQAAFLDGLEREHDNLRDALGRAVDRGYTEAGLRLAAALWRFWFQRGYLHEGRTWLEAMLALEPDSPSPRRARAYVALGGLAYWLSDADATERAYESALRLYRQFGDTAGEAEALYNIAFVPAMRGDMEEARRRFEASLAAANHVGRSDVIAKSKQGLGMTIQTSAPERAVSLLQEALSYYRQQDERLHLADALTGLAQAYVALDQPDLGRSAYVEALRLVGPAMNLPSVATALNGMADLESSAGRHVEAMYLVGAAAALTDRTGARGPLVSARERNAIDAARAAIGTKAADDAITAGRRLTLEESIEYAATLASESAI
jgi:predicted ATPase/class 3 adenylate cyclase